MWECDVWIPSTVWYQCVEICWHTVQQHPTLQYSIKIQDSTLSKLEHMNIYCWGFSLLQRSRYERSEIGVIMFEMLVWDLGVGRSYSIKALFSEFFRRILTNSADFRWFQLSAFSPLISATQNSTEILSTHNTVRRTNRKTELTKFWWCPLSLHTSAPV